MFPLYDENKSLTRPYVNYALIVVNVIVFFFELTGNYEEIIFTYGTIPAFILEGERLLTLITSMFLHGDIMHIFGNMLFLFIFGDNIEDRYGHLYYIIIYLIFGIAGGLAHVLYSGFIVGGDAVFIPTIGASAAISGVLGSYIVFYPKARIVSIVGYRLVRIPAILFLGFWFILQLLYSGSLTSVAYWAHIGGFVIGLVFALVKRMFTTKRRQNQWTRQ
jgi:membrane associated rhomboid family serine protease